ncbi:MAG: response regulator, partial [Magnetococcales bacterium]|nr:response regulator [Magnetococcales bacterium]
MKQANTILIIDDEDAIRASLRGILEDENYEVLEASSGEMALEMLSHHVTSVILLDIWMDGLDGLETLRRIKNYGDAKAEGERNGLRWR